MPCSHDELEKKIKKIALLNAVNHGGKAQPGPVIGKLLAENPSLKPKVKEVAQIVAATVEEINNLTHKEQKDIVKTS